jgi:2-keto-myo-inositol isomerase
MFPFRTSLNASTLFPFELDLKQQARIAAEAGYEGLEVWVKDIDAFLAAGGTLKELRAYVADTGVTLVNAIAFWPWADADEATRERGFAQAERELRMLAELGCRAAAAPPYGNVEATSLDAMAGYFARLAPRAREIGVEPYLEFWGRARRLSRLSEAMYVAIESRVPDVKLLLDPFHMYTGGTDPASLAYLKGANIGVVHVNDYPAAPPRATITDADRVFPGEGIGASHELARMLQSAGYDGFLSLELFISDFGGASALDIARRGREAILAAYSLE